MTLLHLTPASRGPIDAALATVERCVLTRREGAAFADVEPAAVPAFVRALAYAGVRAEPCAHDLTAPAGLLIARGLDLEPLSAVAIPVDVLRLERVPLGCDTRDALRPRLLGILPPAERARDHCRRLLRGDRVTFEWSRLAWGTRSALRSGRARRTLRPLIFSRAVREIPGGRIASDGSEIGRWLFA